MSMTRTPPLYLYTVLGKKKGTQTTSERRLCRRRSPSKAKKRKRKKKNHKYTHAQAQPFAGSRRKKIPKTKKQPRLSLVSSNVTSPLLLEPNVFRRLLTRTHTHARPPPCVFCRLLSHCHTRSSPSSRAKTFPQTRRHQLSTAESLSAQHTAALWCPEYILIASPLAQSHNLAEVSLEAVTGL